MRRLCIFAFLKVSTRISVLCFLVVIISHSFWNFSKAQGSFPLVIRSESSKVLFDEGRRNFVLFRLNDAERIFEELAEQDDGALAAQYYLATISFYKGMMTHNKTYFDEHYQRADTLRHLIRHLPVSMWTEFVDAELHLLHAIAAAKRDKRLKAVWEGRVAYNKLDRVIQTYPNFYEPLAGMGLLHLAVGSLPGSTRRILKLLGFGGSIKQGIDELKAVAENSRLHSESARLVIALANSVFTPSVEHSLQIVQELIYEYPQSMVLAHIYGFLLLSDRRAEEAEDVLRRAEQWGRDSAYIYIHYIDFYIADALFRQNRFAEAETYLRRYLDQHTGPALKTATYYELGLSLEMQGKREAAIPFYSMVKNTRGQDDEASMERATQWLLNKPMTDRERQLLLGRNAYDGGRNREAEAILHEILDDPEALLEERSEAAYRLGRVYHSEDRLEEAKEAYRRAVQYSQDPLAKWAPWSEFYIAEMCSRQGNVEEADAAYRRALAYDDAYDFRDLLEKRARVAMQDIYTSE